MLQKNKKKLEDQKFELSTRRLNLEFRLLDSQLLLEKKEWKDWQRDEEGDKARRTRKSRRTQAYIDMAEIEKEQSSYTKRKTAIRTARAAQIAEYKKLLD